MENIKLVYGILLLSMLLSCSKSDDGSISAPTVHYDQKLKATFFSLGNSDAPEVNWNGDIGSFGLKNTIEGMAIDTKTGVISWNKLLLPGIHNVEILAFNNAGTTTVSITIENPLVGKFKGTLFPALHVVGDSDFILAFDFKDDNTLTGFTQFKNGVDGSIAGPFPFFGSFSTGKNEVRGSFQYEEVGDPIVFGASIDLNGGKAVLSGKYNPDFVCESETCLFTTFELELVIEP